MNRVIIKFLNANSDFDRINKPFNYKFNENSPKIIFKREYKKFLNIYSNFTIIDGRLKTVLNSYDIKLLKKDLKQIFKLFLYSYNHDFFEKNVIGEFLLSYYNSISSSGYKKDGPRKEPLEEYRSVQKDYKLDKAIYNILNDCTYEFYSMLVNYIIDNEEFLYDEIVNRTKLNIKKGEKFNDLVSRLIKIEKYVWSLVEIDNEVVKHSEIYNSYIENQLTNSTIYKYPTKIILKLDNKKVLKKEIFNLIVNDIIDKVNCLYENKVENSDVVTRDISTIDLLLKQINSFFNQLNTIDEIQKEKLRECRINLMTIKRYMLLDENKVRKSMQVFKNEISIETKKIDETVNEICENIYTLYGFSKVDFDIEVGNAIESYSDAPLLDIVSWYQIDSNHQTYYIFDKNEDSNYFKEYYEKIGKNYIELHKNELTNILKNDYYLQLLKHLSRTFFIRQKIIFNFLNSKGKFGYVIEQFKEMMHLKTMNNYTILAHSVIEIELMFKDILKRNNLIVSSSSYENLVNLAKNFEKNDIAFNGLMYINYILYEESGLKIRNNIAHGNLINESLEIPLIVTFSAIVFLQWLYIQ